MASAIGLPSGFVCADVAPTARKKATARPLRGIRTEDDIFVSVQSPLPYDRCY
jgi:hypothetical protein